MDSLDKIGASKMPIPYQVGPCVYFLVNRGVVVYVGKTTRLLCRIGDHLYQIEERGEVKLFDSVYYIEVDFDLLAESEAAFILAYKPKYNKITPGIATWHPKVKEIANLHGLDLGSSPTADDLKQAS